MNHPIEGMPLRRLLTGSALQMLTYIAGIVLGLVLKPYLIDSLGPVHYAIFLFGGLFTNWCGLVDFGMTTTAARFVSLYNARGDADLVRQTAVTSLIVFGGLGCVVLLISCVAGIVALVGWQENPNAELFAVVFLIAGSAFAVSKLTDGFVGILNGMLRQEVSGVLALIFRIFTGVSMLGVLYCGGKVVAILTTNFLLAGLYLFAAAVSVRYCFPTLRLSYREFRRERVRELTRYSVWTFFNQVGELMITRSDLILLAMLMSLTDTAHYELVVVTLISYYASFLQAGTLWQTNWFAHLHGRNDSAMLHASRRTAYKIMTYLTLFLSFGLIFFGEAFVVRWVGEPYLDAFFPMALLAGGMAFYRGRAEVNVRLLQGVARHQWLAMGILLQGGASLFLSLVLIWLGYGLLGAALGTLIPAVIVQGILVPCRICQIFDESRLRYFAAQSVELGTGIVALILPAFIAKQFVAPNYPTLIGVAMVCGIVYVVEIFVIGLNRQERRDFVRHLVGRYPPQEETG